MGGIFAPRPSQGPHKLRECLPLCLILRNRLKYALTRRETIMICMRRMVEVDRRIRTDINYPAGNMDVITIRKSNQQFRLLYDANGRFHLQKISDTEAKFKLCKVVKVQKGKKASVGKNPYLQGQAGSIPYCVTHDGRTIRYPDPRIKVMDTIKFNLVHQKIEGCIKFEVGHLAMVIRGGNLGRIGRIESREKHPGSFDVIHLKDQKGHGFATRIGNIFVIGDKKAWITTPRDKGVRKTIMEKRIIREKKQEKMKG